MYIDNKYIYILPSPSPVTISANHIYFFALSLLSPLPSRRSRNECR